MTTGPKLRLGTSLLPGVFAAALFVLMALIVVNTPFGSMEGFDTSLAITSNIGYAMFDLTALQEIDSEPFLVSFLLIAIVLDAALDASLVLAKREEGGESVTALSSAPGDSGTPQPAATDGGSSEGTEGGENA